MCGVASARVLFVRLTRGEAANPRNTSIARLSRTMSLSSSRPILSPAFDFGTVPSRVAKRTSMDRPFFVMAAEAAVHDKYQCG